MLKTDRLPLWAFNAFRMSVFEFAVRFPHGGVHRARSDRFPRRAAVRLEMSSRNTKAHNCIRNSPNSSGDAPGLRRTVLVVFALEQAIVRQVRLS